LKFQKLNDWFQERYDLSGIKAFAKEKLVPEHKHDIWYYTGGITLFLFILQFITGMVLALYYVPHSGYAYESIIDIVTKLNMGWFFKALHHWGAQLAIVMLFIHMFSTLLLKSYRKPREFLWITGFILVGISIFFGLSGYLMLWDERAFAAVKVATGGAAQLPLIGHFIQIFLRGGIDVTGDTLLRFYAFHVAILPIVSLMVIGLHLLLVQFHGMSVPMSQENKLLKQAPFFPNVLYKDLIIWFVVLGVLLTLATLLPPEIGQKADPLAPPPENIKPEWYFLCLFQTLKQFPGEIMGINGEMIAIMLISVGILILFLVPFIDRKSSRGEKSPLFTAIGIFYFLFFIIMTTIGFLS
jgi:cytochrome b6